MKRAWIGLSFIALAACSSSRREPTDTSPKYNPTGSKVQTYEDIEKHSGEQVTVEGIFGNIRGEHGIIKLDGGLYVYIPHFDRFKMGDDWLKYEGKRCSASGILHTYTKDIPGYHGPSIDINGFSCGSEQ